MLIFIINRPPLGWFRRRFQACFERNIRIDDDRCVECYGKQECIVKTVPFWFNSVMAAKSVSDKKSSNFWMVQNLIEPSGSKKVVWQKVFRIWWVNFHIKGISCNYYTKKTEGRHFDSVILASKTLKIWLHSTMVFV